MHLKVQNHARYKQYKLEEKRQNSKSTVAFARLSDSSKLQLSLCFLFDGNYLCMVPSFGALVWCGGRFVVTDTIATSKSSVLAVTNIFDYPVSEFGELFCLTSLSFRVLEFCLEQSR